MAPVKFLVVDDLEENLLAIQALLQRDELQIFVARSGSDALDLLKEHDFALALLDIQMPEMDGFELATAMRDGERAKHVPLIFLTADWHDQQAMFKGYEAGAVDFLYKPVNPHVLKNKAEVFFQLYRQKQLLVKQLEECTETLRKSETSMAVVAHDLRNPLNTILTSAHLLQKDDDELVRLCGQRATSSARRMSRMIDDILDVARIRVGDGIEIMQEMADLGVLVERVVQEQLVVHLLAHIALHRDGDLTGRWDVERIAQGIAILISNAFQHGDASGGVDLHLDGRDAAQVVIAIGNPGCVPADLRDRLFEPFNSARRTSKGKRGLGLGLYIVKQIVNAHGGTIDAQCDDHQTTFRVVLPRAMR